MASHVTECKIPGYEATYDLLVDFEKNSADYDQNRKFIEFVSALEFNDAVSVWECFGQYTNECVLKHEIDKIFEGNLGFITLVLHLLHL